MFDLKGKVAIITGGAKGIGSATVKSFLDEGAKFVAFIDVDEISGYSLEQELLKLHGKNVVKFFNYDITNDEELFDVFSYTVKHHGYVDVVLNNAAIGDDVMYKKQIEINFSALVSSTLKALEMMRKDCGGRGGTIINVSSIGALCLQKEPTVYIYSATKSAVLMFSNTLGMEAYFAHTGVRVITMCFGLTTTNIIKSLRGIDDISTAGISNVLKEFKGQTPQAAAKGIVEAYKKGKSGSTWFVIEDQITDITERVTKGYQVMAGEIQI